MGAWDELVGSARAHTAGPSLPLSAEPDVAGPGDQVRLAWTLGDLPDSCHRIRAGITATGQRPVRRHDDRGLDWEPFQLWEHAEVLEPRAGDGEATLRLPDSALPSCDGLVSWRAWFSLDREPRPSLRGEAALDVRLPPPADAAAREVAGDGLAVRGVPAALMRGVRTELHVRADGGGTVRARLWRRLTGVQSDAFDLADIAGVFEGLPDRWRRWGGGPPPVLDESVAHEVAPVAVPPDGEAALVLLLDDPRPSVEHAHVTLEWILDLELDGTGRRLSVPLEVR